MITHRRKVLLPITVNRANNGVATSGPAALHFQIIRSAAPLLAESPQSIKLTELQSLLTLEQKYFSSRQKEPQYLFNNQQNAHHPDGGASDVSFAYDELDHPVRMVDGLGESTFSYDVLGHLVNADGPWQNDSVSYSYDNLGRRTGMSVPRDASNNNATSYAYDDLSRLSSITSGAGTFGYNYVGNTSLLTQVDLPNGEKSTFTYDALERLTQLKNLGSGNINISQYDYAYDNTNHLPGRISETSQVGTDVFTLRNYGYDPVNQLVSETVSQSGQTIQSKNFTYDQMGNRTQQTYQNSPDPLHTVSYTNNGLNQMTGVSNTDGTTTTQNAFTYDANGNTTQIASSNSATQYTYDDADRLSAIVYKNDQGVNVSKSTFVYDGLSRLRISDQYTWDTQTSAWVQQSEKRRIYDGMDVVQERDGNNAVTNSYTRSGNIGGILAMVHYTPDGNGGFTSDKYFYHYDGRGNVTQLTNDSQNIVAKYSYDAFGNTTASGAAAELNQYRFSTKEQISGLYYYGYRFYSPGLGRWINRDPIQEAGGTNIYAFVGNNATNSIDVYGLISGKQIYKWMYLGNINATDAEYDAFMNHAGCEIWKNSPFRGISFGIDKDLGKFGKIGVEAGWNIDEGYAVGANVRLGVPVYGIMKNGQVVDFFNPGEKNEKGAGFFTLIGGSLYYSQDCGGQKQFIAGYTKVAELHANVEGGTISAPITLFSFGFDADRFSNLLNSKWYSSKTEFDECGCD